MIYTHTRIGFKIVKNYTYLVEKLFSKISEFF